MMPTCPPSNRSAGFTLIEMLVVLAVLSLVALVMVGNLGRRPVSIARAEAASKLVRAIDKARREASLAGTTQTLMPSTVVEGTSLSATLAGGGAQAGALQLYPDGSSNGGTILLEDRILLTIDWLTGEARHAA